MYTYRTDEHAFYDDERAIDQDETQDIRDAFALASQRWAENLIVLLASGRLTLDQFERELRERQARTFIAQYLLGVGGKSAITDESRQALSDMMADQFTYARGFVEDLANNDLSVAAATARAKQYFSASTQAQASALSEAWGIRLPHRPGDGSTSCGSNCNCRLRIEPQDDGEVHVYWITGSFENCNDCLQRERDYNPLVLTPNE